jgi:thiol-disulfide isomerase/thioredoxin
LKKKLLIILCLAFSAFAGAQTTLDTAVNFTVKDVDGITHRLNEYLEQGKMVLVDFFTITCGPCITYAPEINASYENFGCNNSNIIFLGINWGANNQQVIEFGETYGAYFPKVSGLEGNGNHVVADYQVISYPTVILIMPDGFITEQYIWPPSQQHLDSLLISHGAQSMPCITGISKSQENVGDNLIAKVYPNPATSIFAIETSVKFDGEFTLLNRMGQVVKEQKLTGVSGKKILISITDIPAGYYHIMLKKDGMIVGSAPLLICRN